MEVRERIIEATIDEFNEKNLKFTMDDIAKRLGISKKTIYTIFPDKETLFYQVVDYGFASVKETENKIYNDPSMDIVEKIKKIIIAVPERYQRIDWRQIYAMKEKYPKIYQYIENKIENGWETTIALIEQGIACKRIRPVSIPVVKIMVEGTIENFIGNSKLIQADINYADALQEMIDIVIDGIAL